MTTLELPFPPNSEPNQSELLTDAIQSVIDNANTRINGKGGLGLSKNRIASYGSFKKIIESYQLQTEKTYKVKDVDLTFAENFLDHLLNEKEYSKSYALKKIRDLKTVCRTAKLDGLETNTQLDIIKSPKGKKQNIIFLNSSELQIIENTSIEDPELLNAKKWLLIGCAIGQRVGDLLNLNKNSFIVKNGIEVIELTQDKTGQKVTIPNQKRIKELISDGLPYKVPIQKLNDQIKTVCKLSEINNVITGILFDEVSKRKTKGQYEKHKLINSHVFRRTYALNNYGKFPTSVIRKITGHTTEAILLSYIGKDASSNSEQQSYSLF